MDTNKVLIEEICLKAGIKNARQLAKTMGIHASIITRIRHGQRKFTPMQARFVERLTNGAISREVLRPDIFL